MEKAFVYKWVHLPTLKWYVGYHNGKKRNYVCSSKLIKKHILEKPDEWIREIIQRGSDMEMYLLESTILQTLDAKNDPRSFNGHNNNGESFNTIGRTKEFMSEKEIQNRKNAAKLRSCNGLSKSHRNSLSKSLSGRPNPRFAAQFGKGIPKVKNVCRIEDRKEMNISHFVQWCISKGYKIK